MSRKFFKAILWGAAILPFLMGALAKEKPESDWTLIVGGNTAGYLSPCGCTKPMSGGIRRRATVTQLLSKKNSLIIETGPIVGAPGRQSELKAETLAESLKVMKVNVLALSLNDMVLGEAGLASIERLSNATLLGKEDSPVFQDSRSVVASDTASPSFSLFHAIGRAKEAVRAAQQSKLPSIYITQLDRDSAAQIVESVPELDVIVYTSKSAPRKADDRIGKTWLLTPGPQGQYVMSLAFTGDRFESPTIHTLGPDVHDHSDVSRYYNRYLDRVEQEKLIEMVPKSTDAAYAGTEACRSCHEREYQIWEKSKHALAFETLEADNHDSDPDCVGCHVVGIESSNGFIAKEKTPQFKDVGCESCHGPAENHVKRPNEVRLPTVEALDCLKCHNLANSPNFDFAKYWEKIKH